MISSYSSFEKRDNLRTPSPDSFKNENDKIQVLQRNKFAEPSAADPGTARLGNSNSVVEDALPTDPKYLSLEKTGNNSNFLQKKHKSQFKLSRGSQQPTLKSEGASASAFKVFKQSKRDNKEMEIGRDDKRAFVLVKNQPDGKSGTRKVGERGSMPIVTNDESGNKGLLSKISSEIKTAINQ